MRPSLFHRLILAAGAMTLIAAAAPSTQTRAGPALTGVWRNMRDTIHIRTTPCGQGVCGTVISATPKVDADARRGSGRPLVGQRLFSDFRGSGGVWKGRVYIPDIDRNISGKIVQTDADSITVSGCIFFGLGCKTQHWKRVE